MEVTSQEAAAVSAANPNPTKVTKSSKVWTSLITNTKYLSGLLTLDYSLKLAGSKYPLVAMYTESFPEEGIKALDARGIPKKAIRYLTPKMDKDFSLSVRFYDCWSKLTPFSLVEYDRVVQLDSDMLVLKNMDELMDVELDPPSMNGEGQRVFAAGHACVCNPNKIAHYPKAWVPENCAFTSLHERPDEAQRSGASNLLSLGEPNGGLQVVNPCAAIYEKILNHLETGDIGSYEFADQTMLGDIFHGRWVTLPYIYNALKTLRREGVHSAIWRDKEVKNVHYILDKPWDEKPGEETDETHKWWHEINRKRKDDERSQGIEDEF